MAFSADSRFLCLTSNTETIHIFKIEGPIPKMPHLEEELAQRIKFGLNLTERIIDNEMK